jgi:hypothetical protein
VFEKIRGITSRKSAASYLITIIDSANDIQMLLARSSKFKNATQKSFGALLELF